jgi:hypothetical protein
VSFCHGAWSETKSPLNHPSLADDTTLEIETTALAFLQSTHDFEPLDRGVGRLHRSEATNRADQQLQLAVVGFNDIVEVP